MISNSGQRVWFVTGGSSGFGRAICEEVLSRGDRLVATSRNPDALKDLPEQALLLELDVTDQDDAHRAVDQPVDE